MELGTVRRAWCAAADGRDDASLTMEVGRVAGAPKALHWHGSACRLQAARAELAQVPQFDELAARVRGGQRRKGAARLERVACRLCRGARGARWRGRWPCMCAGSRWAPRAGRSAGAWTRLLGGRRWYHA
eukprot:scaffold96090_cov51-Phaeocystis_antarctica.AAC.1